MAWSADTCFDRVEWAAVAERGEMRAMRCVRSCRPWVSMAWLLAAVAPAATAAPEEARPPVLAEIERSFGEFFLFTTDGSGVYGIYQRIEDRSGLSDADTVVCVLNACFLEIAEVPSAALTDEARAAVGPVRERFRAVRDAYRAMRRTAPEAREAAVASWREALATIAPCLRSPDRC
jgi:hypothetical protein